MSGPVLRSVVVVIADGTPDSQGDILDLDGVELPEVVPVVGDFSTDPAKVWGHARLRRQGDRVLAEVDLNHRVHPEMAKLLYPAVGGKIKVRQGPRVTSWSVDSVGLSVTPNADPRIPRLSEYVKYSQKHSYLVEEVETVTWMTRVEAATPEEAVRLVSDGQGEVVSRSPSFGAARAHREDRVETGATPAATGPKARPRGRRTP